VTVRIGHDAFAVGRRTSTEEPQAFILVREKW